MKNRRQCKRRQLLYQLPVIEEESGVKLGYLIDITAEGIQMISESELPTGKRMPVRIEGVAGCLEGQDIGIVVLIRWCKRDVNGRTWVIGCSISDENGRKVERIIELIYRYTL